MPLPARTTVEDIDVVCRYLSTKPIGATLAEARAVVNKRHLDGRKLAALRFWGLIEDGNNRLKLTDKGRRSIENSGAYQSEVFREVIRGIKPYFSLVERASFRSEDSISATEVARHWYENFKDEVGDSERGLNLQAICFFHFAEGADVGKLTIGRKGQPTRLDFNNEVVSKFFEAPSTNIQVPLPMKESTQVTDSVDSPEKADVPSEEPKVNDGMALPNENRVFITYRRNDDLLRQVNQIVTFGKYEPVNAEECESNGQPNLQTTLKAMRSCNAGIIQVSSDNVLGDVEIGAALALYGDRLILLVEEGINLPEHLQELCACRYSQGKLDVMELLEAFNRFENSKV